LGKPEEKVCFGKEQEAEGHREPSTVHGNNRCLVSFWPISMKNGQEVRGSPHWTVAFKCLTD
jgi:hypothetical protein